LTPKQSEIVTLAVKMGDLSLVLRSLQGAEEGGREPAVIDENAPAESGDSYTQDAQVSRLIRQIPAVTQKEKPVDHSVFVLRGAGRSKVDTDGGELGGDTASSGTKPSDDKQGGRRQVPFTRTVASDQQ